MPGDDSIMSDDEQWNAFLAALLRCEDAASSMLWYQSDAAEAVFLRNLARPIARSAA